MPRHSCKRGKHKEGLYHIQHINALHSNLKKWMNRFNGVATKYINNYIKWFNGFKTVGSFILYKDTLAFMIGPDNTGEKLGVMRLGGHIEENESYLQTLEREIKEEGSMEDKNNLVNRFINGNLN